MAATDGPDGASIERLTGAKGKLSASEGAFKVTMPRNDLAVVVGGLRIPAPMGLACWAAFKRTDDGAMVMGDVVLTEPQVDAAMDAALANGLEVTALHNHFAFDQPRLMYMHIAGRGDEATLATAVGKLFKTIQQTARTPSPTFETGKGKLTTPSLDRALGTPGEIAGGAVKYVFGRETQMGGMTMGATMGVNTWAAFAGDDQHAVVAGDFAVEEPELQGVLHALRDAGISVVAIHSHMTGEEPRILFLHYWGHGAALALAQGISAAVQLTR